MFFFFHSYNVFYCVKCLIFYCWGVVLLNWLIWMTVAEWFCLNLLILTAAVGEFLLIATFLPNYLSCVWMVLGDLLKLEIFIH